MKKQFFQKTYFNKLICALTITATIGVSSLFGALPTFKPIPQAQQLDRKKTKMLSWRE